MKNNIFYSVVLFIVVCLTARPLSVKGYSVLTHEAIIDACWEKTLQPLLVQLYPDATPDQLKEAHAYAYGGAVAPDMGYYPFGNKFFTDLVHYVRSGDFVTAMIEEAQNINEYAFALGIQCHYFADKYGHPIGTNRCVPLVYPKVKKKYGNIVTYEQDPVSHIRMEFGFDVLQTARGNYATTSYHDFIGFKVATGQMERAFKKTYGLELKDVYKDYNLSVKTFRWTVKEFFPTITRIAWRSKKKDIVKTNKTMTRRKFEYKMRNANYYHEYGREREKPGVFATAMAYTIKVMPKIGPLKKLKIKVPGPDAENLFIKSFDTVQKHYIVAIHRLPAKCDLPNIDYDTGHDTRPGEYGLADEAYGKLLLKLKDNHFAAINPALKNNVLAFYSRARVTPDNDNDEWQKIQDALTDLKNSPTN